MCPSCGDVMYANGFAQEWSQIDMWHCYDKSVCGTVVVYKNERSSEIMRIDRHPTFETLDEELERLARSL
jgi:hypothetical protein